MGGRREGVGGGEGGCLRVCGEGGGVRKGCFGKGVQGEVIREKEGRGGGEVFRRGL